MSGGGADGAADAWRGIADGTADASPGRSPGARHRALPLIGAQLSSAGGFLPVPQRALDIGAEVVQIFNTNARTWKPRIPAPGEIETFATALRGHGLRLIFHSIYLINLASPDEELRRRSSEALALALATGALAGAEAVVTHVGSHRGEAMEEAERRVVESISQAVGLAEDSGGPALPALLLETGTGAGNTLGGRLEELQTLLSLEEAASLAGHLPLGICIDTAHLFAGGYAVHEEAGLEAFIEQLKTLGLLQRIGLVHLNDSKTPFGVRRDQHENPGDGLIGYDGLARVVRHPALAHVPFVLEVPGADGHGPDLENMAVVKSMRSGRAHRPAKARRLSDPAGGSGADSPGARRS
jgi:deoxyribonuclease-4